MRSECMSLSLTRDLLARLFLYVCVCVYLLLVEAVINSGNARVRYDIN